MRCSKCGQYAYEEDATVYCIGCNKYQNECTCGEIDLTETRKCEHQYDSFGICKNCGDYKKD